MPEFSPEALESFVSEVFTKAGFPGEEARLIGELIVSANRVGHDSHGIRQVPRYLQRIQSGDIVAGAPVTVDRELPAMAVLNGNRTLGHVAATRALEVAMEKARAMKISAVGVHDLNHIGRIGAYPERAAREGLVCLAWVSAQGPNRSVAPFNGMEKRLGTNPFGAGLPNPDGAPILLDFASSVVAANKIRQAFDRGQETGPGWMIGTDGKPCRDPSVFIEGKAVQLPLGGTVGYKGYGLAVMVDLLGGMLSGGDLTNPDQKITNNCTFFIVIDPEAFLPREEYNQKVRELIAYLKDTPPAPGHEGVILPGEYESSHHEARRKAIFIEPNVWENIAKAGNSIEVTPPAPIG